MKISRLNEIIQDWVRWHKVDEHKLGYPKKVSYLATGGYSSGVFDDMVEVLDLQNVKTLDAIIHSLPKEQKQAIYARYLNEKQPIFFEVKLNLAMENLLDIASRRILA
jgi:hypothetical protein|tara:strand:- start:242 stop:565 length:324 start_codon:yes stop_codon:yes gene_type:complete